MNRYLTFSLTISMTLSTLAIPLRAANKPRAGRLEKNSVLWTNEDLEKLRPLGLISIVGQPNTAEDSTPAAMSPPYAKTRDPEWYAKQAAKLRGELEYRQAHHRQYHQALEKARTPKETTGGKKCANSDIALNASPR